MLDYGLLALSGFKASRTMAPSLSAKRAVLLQGLHRAGPAGTSPRHHQGSDHRSQDSVLAGYNCYSLSKALWPDPRLFHLFKNSYISNIYYMLLNKYYISHMQYYVVYCTIMKGQLTTGAL